MSLRYRAPDSVGLPRSSENCRINVPVIRLINRGYYPRCRASNARRATFPCERLLSVLLASNVEQIITKLNGRRDDRTGWEPCSTVSGGGGGRRKYLENIEVKYFEVIGEVITGGRFCRHEGH